MRTLVIAAIFAAFVAAIWGASLLLEPEGTPPPGSRETEEQSPSGPGHRGPPGKLVPGGDRNDG